MDEAQKNTIHSILLSKECGFANSLVGEQKIKTISISEWTEPKAAQIPVDVIMSNYRWNGEFKISTIVP